MVFASFATMLIPISLALWLLGWSLRPRLSALLARETSSMQANQLSMIIPARDEAHNLPRLLDSIFSQPHPPLEVIVIDDGSTDGTAEVATSHGARVVPSTPLPDGWRGKTWACHQGAKIAAGTHFCFLDADTWFKPNGLDALLNAYQDGAYSLAPWHQIDDAYENLSLFFNLAMVAGTVPKGLFGQLLLIDRDSYHRAGGHEAVRGKVLENVFMAQHFASHDIPVRSAMGRGILCFRMYPSGIRDLIHGWIKGFASGANATSKATLLTMVAWMAGIITPASWMIFSTERWWWVAVYLLCALQIGVLGRKVGSFHPLAALLYPLPLIFFFTVFACSAFKSGKNVTWKGRQIDAT